MKTCLFVIDVQESFRDCDYFSERNFLAYIDNQNTLIEHCLSHDMPIVRIFHTDNDATFTIESGKVISLKELTDFSEDLCVYKTQHSSFIGTELSVWLIKNGITNIIISGIRTEQCCETTTRHASDLGYQMTYVLDATLTFDMPMKNGNVLTAEMIKERTETVLQDRFANVVVVDDIINEQ